MSPPEWYPPNLTMWSDRSPLGAMAAIPGMGKVVPNYQNWLLGSSIIIITRSTPLPQTPRITPLASSIFLTDFLMQNDFQNSAKEISSPSSSFKNATTHCDCTRAEKAWWWIFNLNRPTTQRRHCPKLIDRQRETIVWCHSGVLLLERAAKSCWAHSHTHSHNSHTEQIVVDYSPDLKWEDLVWRCVCVCVCVVIISIKPSSKKRLNLFSNCELWTVLIQSFSHVTERRFFRLLLLLLLLLWLYYHTQVPDTLYAATYKNSHDHFF